MCGYYKRRIGISFQLTPTNESRSWLILAPYQACAEMKETSLELPPGRFPPRIVVYWAFFAMNFVHLCGQKTEKRRFGTCQQGLYSLSGLQQLKVAFSYFNPLFIFSVTFFQMRIFILFYFIFIFIFCKLAKN
jgi:hypothetical protein